MHTGKGVQSRKVGYCWPLVYLDVECGQLFQKFFAALRRRLMTTATAFRISQVHKDGTCKALPLIAQSSICSEASVVSSSQHQGIQADTSFFAL